MLTSATGVASAVGMFGVVVFMAIFSPYCVSATTRS